MQLSQGTKFKGNNNDVIMQISEYPQRYIGSQCPLEFSGEIEKSESEG